MHTSLTISQARQQIDRFYRCETTPAEEEALRRFLLSDELPAELVDDARVILAMTEPELPTVGQDADAERRNIKRKRWAWVGRVAAVLVVAAIGVTAYVGIQTARLEACYGGSYIIENGRRTDNLRRIHRQIEQTLALADADIDPVREAEADVLEAIDDPELHHELETLLAE